MKAIVVAAGMGTRLEQLTEDTPKCLLLVDGKSILQYQLDAYRALFTVDVPANSKKTVSLSAKIEKD